MAAAMDQAGDIPAAGGSATARGDATGLPFPDGSFDRIIAAEVLEHIPDDDAAIGELARVLRPGGTMAVTVPPWLAERICWALSDEYHAPFVEGGHVRIYTASELRAKLRSAGLEPDGAHHAHGIHAPYWWLRCAVGPTNDDHPLVRGLPPGAGVGHRRHAAVAAVHPAGRPGPDAGDRQERRRLRPQAGAAAASAEAAA